MNLYNILKDSFDYGSTRSRNHFPSFALKIATYIIPAVILGHYTDTTVKVFQTNEILGKEVFGYIVLQTLINIITLYLLMVFLSSFSSEFQQTVAGSYFIVLYFGMQTNYIDILQHHMLN